MATRWRQDAIVTRRDATRPRRDRDAMRPRRDKTRRDATATRQRHDRDATATNHCATAARPRRDRNATVATTRATRRPPRMESKRHRKEVLLFGTIWPHIATPWRTRWRATERDAPTCPPTGRQMATPNVTKTAPKTRTSFWYPCDQNGTRIKDFFLVPFCIKSCPPGPPVAERTAPAKGPACHHFEGLLWHKHEGLV